MRNAKKFDARITVGRVPDDEDVEQLVELGYRTLVDVRQEDEKFGGRVERKAKDVGLRYVSIPVDRDHIRLLDVKHFYDVVYEKGSAPLYVFSRYGKKPLAFLLLLEVVANDEPLVRVFERASRIGINLQGDLALRSFLVEFFNNSCMEDVVESIRAYRPELLGKRDGEEFRSSMTYTQREDREGILRQRGCTVWLTGLPSSGKSTTAFSLEYELVRRGHLAYVLDSDNVRHGLNRDLGFSRKEREENIRRIGEMAKLFADAGVITIASFISPFRKDRQLARDIHGAADLGFVEVFVDAPGEVCEKRDSRGLYKKAREGELPHFTGVDDPFERPERADIVINTAELNPSQAVSTIVALLESKGYLGG
jgi:adenylylsulfate kinase